MSMSRSSRALLFAAGVAGAAPLAAGAPLDPLLAATREAPGWALPDTATLRAAEAAFRAMLEAVDAPGHREAWRALGFELRELTLAGRRFSFVHEQAARREGRGAYLFAHDPGAGWLLQAPHVPSDERTGRIAARLAVQGSFRVTAWNTAPRAMARDGATLDTDLAHVPGTYFSALARAYALFAPDGRVLELHGFSRSARSGDAARTADFIVSPGHRGASVAATGFADCLAGVGLGRVLRYPAEVDELGGTTNVNARLLHAQGFDGFIHLEIAPEPRRRLARERAAREAMLSCAR